VLGLDEGKEGQYVKMTTQGSRKHICSKKLIKELMKPKGEKGD